MPILKKRHALCFIAAVILLSSCGSNPPDTSKKPEAALNTTSADESSMMDTAASQTTAPSVPKPGEPGFTFDYTLPENWEPEEFLANNGVKIREILIRMDGINKAIPAEEYFGNADRLCPFAKIMEEDQWNINPQLPKELYELPVNTMSINNTCRIIGGKELEASNPGKPFYYAEAAKTALLLHENYSYQNMDQYKKNALYYTLPNTAIESTYIPQDIKTYTEARESERSAFVTDPSLVYIASDGTIRVRGLCIFELSWPGDVEHFCSIMEVVLGVTPETVKSQPCQWEFGDFYLLSFSDQLQVQSLTEKEFQSLLDQYHVECGAPELPEWAGVYGGNLSATS